MRLKWNRTAFIIVFVMVTMISGSFVYGFLYVINPLKEQTEVIADTVSEQKALLATYPPNQETLNAKKTEYAATQTFLPEGEKVNKDVVALEKASESSNVTITSFSRSIEPEAIEGMDSRYRASVYEVTLTSESPDDMISLLKELNAMERVWNIRSFHFEKDSQEAYVGAFSVTFYSHQTTE